MIRFRLKRIVATVLDTGLPFVVRDNDKPVAVVLPYTWWQQDHEERASLWEENRVLKDRLEKGLW